MSEIWQGFYVLEGIDGSGKSTAIRQLKELYKKKGKGAVSFTSEPTSAGRKMLSALRYRSAPRETHVDSLSYLFAADRNEHLYGNGGIKDRLSQGVKVVCDRYLFSSLVYHGIAGGGEMARRLSAAFPLPEILFLFDISAEEAVERIAARGEEEDSAFERLEFLQKAEREYRRVAAEFEGAGLRIVSVDARLPREEIAGTIWREVWK